MKRHVFHRSYDRPQGHRAGATLSRVALLSAALAWLPACAGEESADEADNRASIKAVAPTTFRDACEIITADDVAAIEGGPIEARPEEARAGETRCVYGPPGSGEWSVLYLVIHWRGGKETWDAWGMGRDLGARLMQDPEVNVDSLIAGDPLAGIGDAAHYGDLLPSLVLKDDVLLEFQMAMLNNPRANFPVLAKKALSRL